MNGNRSFTTDAIWVQCAPPAGLGRGERKRLADTQVPALPPVRAARKPPEGLFVFMCDRNGSGRLAGN